VIQSRDEPRLLEVDLLCELEQRWQAQGAVITGALRPGLTDDEMDTLTEPFGMRLPAEARRWRGWHDDADPQPPGAAAEVGPERAFLPLARAVRNARGFRGSCEWRGAGSWPGLEAGMAANRCE